MIGTGYFVTWGIILYTFIAGVAWAWIADRWLPPYKDNDKSFVPEGATRALAAFFWPIAVPFMFGLLAAHRWFAPKPEPAHERQSKAHADKAAFYESKRKELEDAGLRSSGGSLDTLRDLTSKIGEHQQHASFFAFLRDHLIKGETYRLDEDDMRHVAFISGGRYF